MKRIISFAVIIVALLSLVSCANEANTHKEFIVNTNLIASGPLFEGSNTCQAELSAELSAFLAENDIKKEELVDVTLTSCTVKSGNLDNLDLVESINLQVMSENFPMQNVAVINPIEKGKKEVELKVADLQEQIMPVLQEETCFIIADAIINEDYDDDLNLETKLVFSINYYKQ